MDVLQTTSHLSRYSGTHRLVGLGLLGLQLRGLALRLGVVHLLLLELHRLVAHRGLRVDEGALSFVTVVLLFM